ncbi:MBL fold metallo-hydrolase [Pectobacterium versatile]|uniref:MBL fold metallo-hydrolase n=1 Tax=Pectobacterium versatile TaxID=2488639 RepID=A0A855MA93_9GAMM|nr:MULTISPECIES: MBL fold metallo-hydrolase [Pectobacterium]ASN84336.1 MBL fold metallo-hydrolase [Pectobacterium versatile]MBA0183871.1 MBL fold metallo-hydrolase [Pectobacterium versatile]MBN3195295.1 MBL fold metallo-hydrolase [Pectobacterium versatile]MBN3236424.1 MBL fold metallo-hydrolase [Pectobacterium versatile]MBQ4765120.1 MBL fold metallo-hydrolase [Pectobacterium versatile]
MKLLKPLALLLISSAFVPAFVQAQDIAQIKTQPGYYRMMLGQFEITALSDGTNTMPMDKLLQRTPPEKITELLAEKSLTPQVETSINAYLVNTGKHLILIDTGNGKQSNPTVGKVLPNLIAAGYKPEQVDTVLMTHLHGDHFGGLVQDNKLNYPNATVYVSQPETDFWLSPDNLKSAPENRKAAFQRVQSTFDVIRKENKLKTFPAPQAVLLPGITAIPSPGHTPGHTSFLIESEGKKLLAWGDIIHAEAVQMSLPATTISFDSNMDQATESRNKVLADAASQGYWVAGAHLPFPGIGHVGTRLERNGTTNGYRWLPANYSVAGLSQ